MLLPAGNVDCLAEWARKETTSTGFVVEAFVSKIKLDPKHNDSL